VSSPSSAVARLVVVGAVVYALVCAGFVPSTLVGQSAPRSSLPAESAGDAPPETVRELTSLMDRGDWARARTRVGEALARHPTDATLLNIAGAVEAQQGKHEEAERYFRAAIGAAPRAESGYLNLGRLYQERSTSDPEASAKALEVYESLLRVDAQHTEAAFQAAIVSARMAKWPMSHAYLERLPVAVRARPQALALLAVVWRGLSNRGRSDEVAARLLAHPELSEDDVLVLVPVMARVKAEDLSERLLTGLDGRGLATVRSLGLLASLYAQQKRFREGRAAFERAMRVAGAPTASMLLDAARMAYGERDFKGALGYLAQARDLEPENAQVHFFFGLVSVELNLGAEAFESLKKAVTLAPDNPYVNYALGSVAIHRHEPSEALPYFEAYVRLKPGDPRGRFALGAARFYANDLEGARSALNEAVHAPETAAGAHYFLGRIARQLNELDAARREIDRALALNPRHADAWAELGLLQTRGRDYVGAEQSLARALAIDSENHAATVNLAALYGRTRDPRLDEQKARLEALQRKREAAAQEFLRMIEVVP
jgi:tetratricopeptide (TPR) repeat protein